MKKIIYCTIALAAILLATSCDPDPLTLESTTKVNLNLRAVYGSSDNPLLIQKEYDYADGKKIKFTNVSFYISEVALIKDNNGTEETALKDVELLTFNHYAADSMMAVAGTTIALDNVPVGDYAGIRIGIGVPADLNRTDPEDYGMEHPLASNEHYWSGWTSYIFSKIEGFTDDNDDGVLDLGLTYHTGMDPAFREKIIFKDIVLTAEQTMDFDFTIDVQRLFMDSESHIDIIQFPESHDGDATSTEMMDNYIDALILE